MREEPSQETLCTRKSLYPDDISLSTLSLLEPCRAHRILLSSFRLKPALVKHVEKKGFWGPHSESRGRGRAGAGLSEPHLLEGLGYSLMTTEAPSLAPEAPALSSCDMMLLTQGLREAERQSNPPSIATQPHCPGCLLLAGPLGARVRQSPHHRLIDQVGHACTLG
jgi:hypothetical protein